MARTGRPPKPLEQKRRTGNPGKRTLPELSKTVALEPASSIPPVPFDLDDFARGIWSMVWSSPAQAWLSPQLDAPMRVKTVCRLHSEIHRLVEMIDKLGTLLSEPITTPTGIVVGERIVPNPAVKMLRDVEKQLDRELSALGFDPTARARLGLAEVKRQSILQRLIDDERQPVEGQIIDIEDLADDG